MAEPAMRVALLARAGNARDQLHRALTDLGADLVAEGDPSELDPVRVVGLKPELVIISLEPAIEAAVDRFDDLLAMPGVDVMYDDAEVTRLLDGWDLNRWARHLAAKLLGRDVMPPPPEGAGSVPQAMAAVNDSSFTASGTSAAGDRTIERASVSAPIEMIELKDDIAADLPLPSLGLDLDLADLEQAISQMDAGVQAPHVELAHSGSGAGRIEDEFVFDADLESFEQMVEVGHRTPSAPASSVSESPLLIDLDFDAQPEGFSRFGSNDDSPVNTLDDDVAALSAQLDALTENGQHRQPQEPDFSRAAPSASPDIVRQEIKQPVPEKKSAASDAGMTRQNFDFSSLSLAPIDDVPVIAAPVSVKPPPAITGHMNLTLEGMSDESAVEELVAADGALLILAGLGGPDAVRQLLKVLPERLPVPVLLYQHLEVGNHDRLVSQLAKVSVCPVYLASAGMRAQPGQVAVLPQGLGAKLEGGALVFAPMGSQRAMIESLPATDTLVFVLSGADPEAVPAALALAAQGGTIMAQDPAACFDAAAAQALVAGGAGSGDAAVLAQRLAVRWL